MLVRIGNERVSLINDIKLHVNQVRLARMVDAAVSARKPLYIDNVELSEYELKIMQCEWKEINETTKIN
jgi:hypothetical protein